ncbi:MAG: zinc-binding dehydrogenase [Acidobacteria bacterium]|nr:zinc-binding dehydrogenase [Acidobacteriota bacterium]
MRVKSARIHAHGGLDQIVVDEFDLREPGAGEVRVGVRAAALNHLDLFVLAGIPGIDMPLPHVLGADGAGVVEAVGPDVTNVAVGDEVILNPGLSCGTCPNCMAGEQSMCPRYEIFGEHLDGTFAQAIVVPSINCHPKPERLSWEQAGSFALATLTAWRMIATNAGVGPGQTVLIHGVGGGVSLVAMQIALAAGAEVFVTGHSEEKLKRAADLGATRCWDYRSANIAREVRSATDKVGVDIVVDNVGEATFADSIKACRKGGVIVTCGGTTGPKLPVDVRYLFWNHIRIMGSTMGNEVDFQRMLAAVSSGAIEPVVDSVFELEDTVKAFERLQAAEQFGKVAVRPS